MFKRVAFNKKTRTTMYNGIMAKQGGVEDDTRKQGKPEGWEGVEVTERKPAV